LNYSKRFLKEVHYAYTVTERTNRNSLTAFGDIPDARNATAPARLGSVVMCAEAVSRN